MATREEKIDAGVKARNDALNAGRTPHPSTAHDAAYNARFGGGGTVEDRNRAIDKGVADRNTAIDKGVAARNTALNPPKSTGSGAKGGTTKSTGSGSKSVSGSKGSQPAGGSSKPVSKAPAFLAPMAKQINKLTRWKNEVQAGPGVNVTRTAGNLVIGLKPATETDDTSANELHYNRNGIQIHIDGDGIAVEDSNTNLSFEIRLSENLFQFGNNSTGKYFELPLSALTYSIVPTVFVGCDSGTPKNYVTFASEFYT